MQLTIDLLVVPVALGEVLLDSLLDRLLPPSGVDVLLVGLLPVAGVPGLLVALLVVLGVEGLLDDVDALAGVVEDFLVIGLLTGSVLLDLDSGVRVGVACGPTVVVLPVSCSTFVPR